LVGWSLVAVSCASAWGQEALNYSLAGDRAAQARRMALEHQRSNLALGPVRLLLASSLGLEYNDNINVASQGELADVILKPEVGFSSSWPLTDRNALNLGLSLGYAAYLDHPEYSYAIIRPGSGLGFDLYVEDFVIDIHDQFHYTEDPVSQGAVSNQGQYGGFYNTAGASVAWDLNQLVLASGYDYFLFESSAPFYDYLSRGAHSVFLRLTARSRSGLKGGLETAGSRNEYDESILNNSWNGSLGAFVDWAISEHVDTQARGGFTRYRFDSGGQVGPTPDSQGYYLDLRLNHRPNQSFSHSLDAGRSITLGVNADLLDLWYVRYDLSVGLRPGLALRPRFYFEYGTEEGGLYGVADVYRRFGFGLDLSYQIMEKVEAQLGYALTIKNDDLPERDYQQSLVQLRLIYRF
jgi:hypothetical protein